MTIKAGHCTLCGTQTWRGLIRPDTQEWSPLFPDPTSVYAILETTLQGFRIVGIGYCAACAPAVGDAGPVELVADGQPVGPSTVIHVDRAPERYTYWFSSQYGDWLVAWLRDEMGTKFKFPEVEADKIREQWRADREAVMVNA